ncbi:uncharacterized protein LOC110225779 [Arabidopsis lyrata subsp. lyrata]|uniref:uncharacterized protein LOC110225779 n=1 Tax=Arabidopsis lyrata subsp. lyrata TaxID=81972 RepID=UPI000A29DD93|nr:uncharacterized protein LOC110225779 [Arabidopsis lyrata subsp. lyrata]|eukprot:XP_020871415.1 uncharacterized protein LOC110225779 [Arabidopsis lyrata subsp. lyrata]
MDLSDNEWVNNNGEDKREVIFMASQPNLLASTSKGIVEKQTEEAKEEPKIRFLSGVQRENILKNINDQFGIDLSWSCVKNRLDTLKKFYNIYKGNPENPRIQRYLQFVPLLDAIFGIAVL